MAESFSHLIAEGERLKHSVPADVSDVITGLIDYLQEITAREGSHYLNAINEYRLALEESLRIASDPFKAPEQVVESAREVGIAMWDMQIEYIAMMRNAERRKDAR